MRSRRSVAQRFEELRHGRNPGELDVILNQAVTLVATWERLDTGYRASILEVLRDLAPTFTTELCRLNAVVTRGNPDVR